jgi:hypothetical protein
MVAGALGALANPASAASNTLLGVSSSSVSAHEQWMGRKMDLVHVFLNQRGSWEDMVKSSSGVASTWGGRGYQVVVSVPMTLWKSGSNSQGASGAYDGYFRRVAQNLKDGGLGNAILRVGWEFDGDWLQWAAFKDPDAYKRNFRRIVTTMQSVSPGFRIDWTSNINGGKAVDSLYPGDDVVDIIGMDVYDQSFSSSQKDPAARWQQMLTGTNGLEWQRDFAKAHGKTMSYPEWGLSLEHVSGATPDNTLFIQNMFNWIKSNNVSYSAYFDQDSGYSAHQIRPTSRFPNGSSKYKSLFKNGFGSASTPSGEADPVPVAPNSGVGLIDSGAATDGGFTGGRATSGSGAIAGTDDDALYNTARVASTDTGSFSYAVSVPGPGRYTVKLYFAELWFTGEAGRGAAGPGRRVFDVKLEGQTVLHDFDINAVAGPRTAVTRTFSIDAKDDTIDLLFPAASVNRPIVSAVEVRAA